MVRMLNLFIVMWALHEMSCNEDHIPVYFKVIIVSHSIPVDSHPRLGGWGQFVETIGDQLLISEGGSS